MTLSLSPRLSRLPHGRPPDTPSLSPLASSGYGSTTPFHFLASHHLSRSKREEGRRTNDLPARRPKASLPSPFQTFVRSILFQPSERLIYMPETFPPFRPSISPPAALRPPWRLPSAPSDHFPTSSLLPLSSKIRPWDLGSIAASFTHHKVRFDFLSPLSLARGCGAPRR